MLEQLFGSKTRAKLMRIFLDNPERKFYVRELTRMSDSLINSVRRELAKMVESKFIKAEHAAADRSDKKGLNAKRYYSLNTTNLFLRDLENLFAKGKILLERRLVERIKRLGDVKYLAFGGIFIDDQKAKTDILIIGELAAERAKESLDRFEKEIGKPIRYTIMNEGEYILRRDIADSFLKNIMENEENLIVVNNIENRK
ncbi:hypothetical protein HZB94_04730 [Candidatus Falkowbacteria bacterium]|nr:hypothetical protein [Candidatus Falkowbacteria bacterium]